MPSLSPVHRVSLTLLLVLSAHVPASEAQLPNRQPNKSERIAIEQAIRSLAGSVAIDRSTIHIQTFPATEKGNATLPTVASLYAAPSLVSGLCRADGYRITLKPAGGHEITQPDYRAWLPVNAACPASESAITFDNNAARWMVRYVFRHRTTMTDGARRLIGGHSCRQGMGLTRDPLLIDRVYPRPQEGRLDIVAVFRTTAFQGKPPTYPLYRAHVEFRSLGQDYMPWNVAC
ncbi:hypothetical protein [Chitinimonas naiadis]